MTPRIVPHASGGRWIGWLVSDRWQTWEDRVVSRGSGVLFGTCQV